MKHLIDKQIKLEINGKQHTHKKPRTIISSF